MKAARALARVAAVAVLTVTVGVAINQILNGTTLQPLWLITGLVLAALAETLQQWLARCDAVAGSITPVLWPQLTDTSGRPKTLREVTPRDLGVHANRFATGQQPPYIPRDVDAVLHEALTGGKRLIVVRGPRLAGCTATLAHAVLTHLPGHYRIMAFHHDPSLPLQQVLQHAAHLTARAKTADAVLWLDGLPPERAGDLASLALDTLPATLRIAVTLTRGPDHEQPPDAQLEAFLDQRAVQADLAAISPAERHALRDCDTYAELRPILAEGHDVLMGRLMVSWEELRRALTREGEQSTDRVTLLHAVTDWYRLRLDTHRLLTADILKHLFAQYRREIVDLPLDTPIPVTGRRAALTWAMAADSPARPRLIYQQATGSGRRYAPHPLLTALAEEPEEPAAWPVYDALWTYADQYFEADQRRDIGYAALERQAYPAAIMLLDHSDADIDATVLFRIGVWLSESEDFDGARRWWGKIIATGHLDVAPRAMVNLGVLEKQQGNVEEARRWYREAIATGHPDQAPVAMRCLGMLEEALGNLTGAQHWYRDAIATDHPEEAPKAMTNLGVLEEKLGDFEQARHWYREAIATGHTDGAPRAMANLGMLEEEQGDTAEARRWYGETAATGHHEVAPKAMNNLGMLEEELGDFEQARHWYREAIATGHPDGAPHAMVSLGVLEKRQGDLGEAGRWYRKAIATGHSDQAPVAMRCLGMLEEALGNLTGAQHWYRDAIATDHPEEAPKAMTNLGVLEEKLGDFEQARHWYREAIATGHTDGAPRAMANLGMLEEEQGDTAEARRWYGETAATGHHEVAPKAMNNLGMLEEKLGDFEQARHWYREAIATGHTDEAPRAAAQLRDLDRREKEMQQASWYARYGYLAYADPSMMRRPSASQHPEEEEPPAPQ
ncbi:tetratricopeptide repeat protein [Nonomuraea jabiensis]|uniref:TPR repeat protein n=1 Tax=Nonomuraea jabiensis TaxID=882448 RepID=A0A7W9GDV3_9ACTN|nr:tetratricopeptide repeat protein [Nonomuraea jabiensis]MBB5781868.1 TPR repeat protein [Nonomuraea jabiensis]